MQEEIRILIADDEPGIRRVASRALKSEGFQIAEYEDGKSAYEAALNEHFDLLILDVNMGEMDGFTVIEKLREKNITVPILVVTGNDEEYNEVYGLSIGADDYIIKPFRPSALSARVKAILRRYNTIQDSSSTLKAGPFTMKTDSQTVYKNGSELYLTPKEKALMFYFMQNQNQVLTKDQIYSYVWKSDIVDDNTIMVTIRNLRQKIEDNPAKPKHLLTVYGTGYRMVSGE